MVTVTATLPDESSTPASSVTTMASTYTQRTRQTPTVTALTRLLLSGLALCSFLLLPGCASSPAAADTPVLRTGPAPTGARTHAVGSAVAARSGDNRAPAFVEVIGVETDDDDLAEDTDIYTPVAWDQPYGTAEQLAESCTGATAAWFPVGSSALDPGDRARLDALVDCLAQADVVGQGVRVVGLASPVEVSLYGEGLAGQRARAVADYLRARADVVEFFDDDLRIDVDTELLDYEIVE